MHGWVCTHACMMMVSRTLCISRPSITVVHIPILTYSRITSKLYEEMAVAHKVNAM